MPLPVSATCKRKDCDKSATVWVLWAEGMAVIPACDMHKQSFADEKGDDFVGFRDMGWHSKTLELTPQLLTSMNYLAKNIGKELPVKSVPRYNFDGEEISELKQLAVVMGIPESVASLYAMRDGTPELKAQGLEYVTDNVLFRNLSVNEYIQKILSTDVEKKKVRLVRTVLGARRFSQPRGSIIVTDGEAPLNNIRALPNDVRGYDKLTDSKGRVFYIGEEANRWVVRAPGQHKPLFYGDSDKDAYYWLDNAVVGKKPKAKKS